MKRVLLSALLLLTLATTAALGWLLATESGLRWVYQQVESTQGPGVAMGAAEPREVITNPGEYHYEWTRGGRPVPAMRAVATEDDANDSNE